MTDARCEPPPELRGKDGWHWVVWTPTGETEPYNPVAIWWDAEALGWCPDLPKCADTRELTEYRYLSPVLTPAEVEALRQKYQDDMHAAIVQVGQWSQRSGQLEGERDAVAIAFRKLGAVLRVNMLRWVPEASHAMIDGAIDACLGPVARRVLNDDHIADPGKMVTSPVVKDCLTTQAAFAAGAAEMRERAAGVAEAFPARTHGALATAPYAAAEQAAEEVAAAIRALPMPAGGAGWRPIETAPRDGTSILCYAPGTPDRAAVRRTDYWWLEQNAFAHMRPSQPYTHWQPLPAAPEGFGT